MVRSTAPTDRRSARSPLTRLLVAAGIIFAISVQSLPAIAATIQTDLFIYMNGDTVTVTGDGFGPAETVDVVTTSPTAAPVDSGTADTDDLGNFSYRFILSTDESGLFDVVATGRTSGLEATTQFDPPAISVTPPSNNFGNVTVGTTSSAATFTITNTGSGTNNKLTVTAVSSSSARFPVTVTGLPVTLNPNATKTFTVAFSPTAPGVASATITVASDAA
jgi:hypothetical protein